MPRQPKDFQIAWSSIEKLVPSGYLRIGPDAVVPSRFKAVITMAVPQMLVTMEIAVVAPEMRPRVIEISLRANTATPITTTVLRQVLIDQLVREAMSKAIVPASEAPDVDPRAFGTAATAQERAQASAEQDARQAARIYSEAVASGSAAPAVAVANAMNRSRSQAARYIRKARELGLLPALGSTEAVIE
jgi:hypothetical protein